MPLQNFRPQESAKATRKRYWTRQALRINGRIALDVAELCVCVYIVCLCVKERVCIYMYVELTLHLDFANLSNTQSTSLRHQNVEQRNLERRQKQFKHLPN